MLTSVGGIFSIVVVVLLITGIAWPVLRGREWLLGQATKDFECLINKFNLSRIEQEGSVLLRFPVYVGALVTVTEISPPLWVPRQNVRPVVNSLVLFSFKFGLFTILAPYVLFMVLLNYALHLPEVIGG